MKSFVAILLPLAFLGANLSGASAPGGQYFTGQAARMIIGQTTFTSAMPGTTSRIIGAAGGVAYANDTVFIGDSSRFSDATPQNRRVLIYRQMSSKFPSPGAAIAPGISRCPVCSGRDEFPYPADVVLGQPDFDATNPAPAITQSGLRLPVAVASDGQILAVADTENNRVLIWNSIPSYNNAPADIVLGQSGFNSIQQGTSVSGSNFRGPQGVWIQNGRLYVADTGNHRVLIWRSIPTKNAQAADIVLGQTSLGASYAPQLADVSKSATSTAILTPVSVTADSKHVFVSDVGYQRVLIWNSIPDKNNVPADVVIGEPDMTSYKNDGSVKNADGDYELVVTSNDGGNDVRRMCAPNGEDEDSYTTWPVMCASTLSFPRFALSDGHRLYIADSGNDRILIYNSIPTSNGPAADIVLGQKDMITDRVTDATSSSSTFNPNLLFSSADTIRTPTTLAWDGQNLYVADPYDRRVMVFTPAQANVGMNAVTNTASMNVSAIGSIKVTANPTTDDYVTVTITLVTNTAVGATNNGVKIKQATSKVTNDYTYTAVPGDKIKDVVVGLAAIINAGYGDPLVYAIPNIDTSTITLVAKAPGTDANSITLSSTLSSGATVAVSLTNPSGGQTLGVVSPGSLVTVTGSNLADATVSAPANADPLPVDLGGVQVYFDGIRAPLLYVSPTQINAQVPYEVIDSNAITSWVRTTHSDGSVTVTSASGVMVASANPGIFAQSGQDPRPAYAYHYSNFATLSILVDGSIKGGDTGTITINNRNYTYIVQGSTDTLVAVRDSLIALINNNPDEIVRASAGGAFTRILLQAKAAGPSGDDIAVSVSTSSGASLTLSPSGSRLCCANKADALVTPDNPAVPGEMIYVWAAGLGLVTPDAAKEGLRTGYSYNGPVLNNAVESVSSLVGGKTGNIIFASAVQGTVGLYKVVLELNSGLTTNPVTQMTIAQEDFVSNQTTIPIVAP